MMNLFEAWLASRKIFVFARFPNFFFPFTGPRLPPELGLFCSRDGPLFELNFQSGLSLPVEGRWAESMWHPREKLAASTLLHSSQRESAPPPTPHPPVPKNIIETKEGKKNMGNGEGRVRNRIERRTKPLLLSWLLIFAPLLAREIVFQNH
jgi:hypothetical protein